MAKPQPGEHAAHFQPYISLVDAQDATGAVNKYSAALDAFYTSLPEEKADYAYGPGKWTLKEVLQHIMDTERVFAYRLLCISRNDVSPLPSFDENNYAANAEASRRSFASLKEEFRAVRTSTDLLILSLTPEQLSRVGVSGTHPAMANSFVFTIFGHLLHHKRITEERYF